jgi:hypothetical protein
MGYQITLSNYKLPHQNKPLWESNRIWLANLLRLCDLLDVPSLGIIHMYQGIKN